MKTRSYSSILITAPLAIALLATGAAAAGSTLMSDAAEPNSTPPPPPMITSGSLPNGTDYAEYNYHQQLVPSCKSWTFCRCYQGFPGHIVCYQYGYGFQLTASGGKQPYSWKWVATTKLGLPPGLQMSAAGLIEGSPTRAGTYGVAVTVTDSSLPTAHATAGYTITIKPPPPPQFNTVSMLAPAINVPFRWAFVATGGQTPLTWSEAGTLPSGLSLSSQGGVLSGTPLVTGSFPVTIKVQDSAGQSTPQALTIVVTPHGFGMTGGMSTPRSSHTATLLKDGTVLIAGGNNDAIAVANSELYSPANAAFSSSGALGTARYSHTATRLGTGQVLVAGGDDSNGIAMASAELYEPNSKTFTTLGNMVSPRGSHTATLLANGKVLLTGGANESTYGIILFEQATAELFDPTTKKFSTTGDMSVPRAGHTATLLGTGKVLIAGGTIADGVVTASAELYDAATGKFTLTGAMNKPRYAHTATLLANGTVLVTGGISPGQTGNEMLTSAEIYDPKSGTFTTTGSMGTGRASHTAASLSDGFVLVAGGIDQNGNPLLSAEVYAPVSRQFSLTGGLQVPSASHAATVLGTGAVLVTGGNNATGPGLTVAPGGVTTGAISTAEVYR